MGKKVTLARMTSEHSKRVQAEREYKKRFQGVTELTKEQIAGLSPS